MKNVKKSISKEEEFAKRYLMNIEKYQLRINAKCKQLNELEKYANLIGYKNIDSVFTSNLQITSKTENAAIKKRDLVIEIKNDIYKYTLVKNNIINDIEKINDSRYINVLLKKYDDLKSLEEISIEMGYSYETIRHFHNKALKKMYEILKN